jgi:hypothetical protein
MIVKISKADAIAHLAKWFDARTDIRATLTTVTGRLCIVGKIRELTDAAIKMTGKDCEVLLSLKSASLYGYEDGQALPKANNAAPNGYSTVIDIKFAGGERLDIVDSFTE